MLQRSSIPGLLGGVALSLLGCTEEPPKLHYRKLGQHRPGEVPALQFEAVETPSFFGIQAVCEGPEPSEWPKAVSLTIRDLNGTVKIADRVDSTDLFVSNWHGPSSAVGLTWTLEGKHTTDYLETGNAYLLEVDTVGFQGTTGCEYLVNQYYYKQRPWWERLLVR